MSYIGIPPFGQTVRTVTEATATAGQTTFNITGGYVVGYVDVFLNGVLLAASDFTATNGTTVVLASGAALNDEFKAIAYQPISIVDALRASNNLSDLTSASTARTNLGLAIGTNVQAYDANTAKTNVEQTFSAKQIFTDTQKIQQILEKMTVSATAATGTINYDCLTQAALYYTSNASANWTVNFRGSSGTSLNTMMATGESITVAFLVTQGATPYYNNAVQVDGNAVTPKYQGGSAWTAGNASGIDVYSYTIIKTGSAAFTVLASQTQFK